MKEQKINTKVGVFVFLGVMLLVISIFAISGDQVLFADQYRLKTKFKHVTGLGPGSVVQVLGFPVGNVESIEFDKDSTDLVVTLRLYSEFQNKITKGSIADVRTKGALGDKYIYIEPGDSDLVLKEGEFVAANSEEDFLSMISSQASEIDRVFSILKKLDQILTDVNGEGQVKEMMTGFKDTAGELKLIAKDLRSVTKSFNDNQTGTEISIAAKRLNNVLDKIDKGEGTLGALINDSSLHDSLKRLLGAKSYNNTLKAVIRTSIQENEKE